jgi:hypothetical protein
MAKHTSDTNIPTKKFLAAVSLTLCLGSVGVLANAGTAAAEPAIIDEDGTFGSTDVTGEHGWDWVDATFSYVTSSYPAQSSWPGGPARCGGC